MSETTNEAIFWCCFLAFNSVFFLPNYLLHYPDASLFPQKWKQARKLGTGIGMEENPDIFRISIDLSTVMLLTRYFNIPIGWLVGYFGFMWVFNVYYLIFKKIYEFDPILLNDVRLLKNAAGLLWGEDKLKFAGNALALLTIIGLLIWSFSTFINFGSILPPTEVTHILTGVLGLVTLVIVLKHQYKHYHSTHYRFLFVPMRLIQNLKDSIKLYQQTKSTNWKKLDQSRLSTATLQKKPNVYLLFIESYGSILLKEPAISSRYTEEFLQFDESLDQSGWKMRSQLSESVSLVGPSWLAYTSVLLGQRVDSNFQYERLLSDKQFHKYDTMSKYLQRQGYRSYNLNASKPKKGVATPLEQMKHLYGIDEWILKEHIDFTGTKYGFTEGPSDQYVLNYGLEEVIQKKDDPFVLFYLTKNSHSPFISPSAPVTDWRELNDGNEQLVGNHFLQKPVLSDYMDAIDYQLKCLSDFIIKHGKEEDVFLLIGDHQPHHIADINKHGLETFVHVISKNQDFVDGFKEYGFQQGLPAQGASLKHESLYSIFMRELLRTYGSPNVPLPDFEPDGLKF